MKIPRPPFNSLSEELAFAALTEGDCIGYEALLLTAIAQPLSPPEGALAAFIVMDGDESSEALKIARFKQFDAVASPPTATSGVPLTDLGFYKITGKDNIMNFRIVSTEPGKQHKAIIHYFA